MLEQYQRYLRLNRLPHIWCPGCGNGIVINALIRAIDELGYDQDRVAIVGGIGCSSRAVGYLNFDTLHTTHGRALAFATGLKLARPELKVFVIMGDGDGLAIGGNHFIHAARRNIDLTAIIINNYIYGMTGGQYSPQTPLKNKATTAPYGMIERNFDTAELARAAGATYIGRATVYHTGLLKKLIVNGSRHQGFSIIEAISICPVSYGRRNKTGDAVAMLKQLKEDAISVSTAKNKTPAELKGRLLIGELYQTEAAEYTAAYNEVIARAQSM